MMAQRTRRRHADRDGFTLVELLVVIAILMLLVGMLMPSLRGAREAARRAACASGLHQLAVAHRSYAAAHQGFYPRGRDYLTTEYPQAGGVRGIPGYPNLPSIPEKSILLVGGYLGGGVELFTCPSDEGLRNAPGTAVADPIQPASFSYTRNGSIYAAGGSKYIPITEVARPADTILLLEEWEYAPMNDSYVLGNSWDLVTQRHGGWGMMAFFDDHAELVDTRRFNTQTPLWRYERFFNP